MATPLKPWERVSRNGGVSSITSSYSPTPQLGISSRIADNEKRSSTTASVNTVPSIPPRATGSTSGYFSSQPYTPSFGGGYGGIGGGLGGGYGYGYRPYGGLGMYGGGAYGNLNVDSPFIRQAEESTRTAFQSVESVVGAVSSVSAMLESTYMAVHSCFRAVLGVAQHFTRLRNYVWDIMSAVAVLHRLRFWVKKLLRFFRMRRSSEREELWEETVLANENSSLLAISGLARENRIWPAVIFFAIIFGVPWLLWKLMSSIVAATTGADSEWHEEERGDQPQVTARALYDFCPQREDELGFSAGDELVLAPRQLQSGWVLAGKDRKSGLVPINYIQIQSSVRNTPGGHGSDSETLPIAQSVTPDENTLSNSNSSSSARNQQLRAEETLLND